MRFQGLFHSSVRGAFHLSLTVLVRYRSLAVFSLSGWSPIIRPGFLVSRVTQVPASRLPPISPTGLSPSTAGRSRPSGYRQQPRQRRSYNPGQAGLGSSAFARRYWRNHSYFLFLRVMRCFSSPGRPAAYAACRALRAAGSPIRTSPDQGACAAPRSFSQLVASFFACKSQGIPRMPSFTFLFPSAGSAPRGPLSQGKGAAAPPGARSLLFKLLPSCQ